MTDDTTDHRAEEPPQLIPAEQNLYWIMATVYGAPNFDDYGSEKYEHRHEKNRSLWNRWVAPTLDGKTRASLIVKDILNENDFKGLNKEEEIDVLKAIRQRLGKNSESIPGAYGVNLSNTEFLYSDFSGFIFKDAMFSSAIFYKLSNFQDVIFLKSATFEDATFCEDVFFLGTSFSDWTNFRGAVFHESAQFGGAVFSWTVSFWGAVFFSRASFDGVTFSDLAIFDDAAFSQWANFAGATFSQTANFAVAAFSGRALFDRCRFDGGLWLTGAQFSSAPPTFHGAPMPQGAVLDAVAWPGTQAVLRLLSATERDGEERRELLSQARRAYETLKLAMAGHNRHREEHMFLRLEQEFVRAQDRMEGWWLSWLTGATFQVVSDSGWSLGRPLLAMLYVWIGGAAAMTAGVSLHWWDTLRLSFANLFAVSGLRRFWFPDAAALVDRMNDWAELVSGVQGIIGPILVFLFALALRNRFKIS